MGGCEPARGTSTDESDLMTAASCAAQRTVPSAGVIEFGVLDWFNGDLGFGFFASDDGRPDVFVHLSELVGNDGRAVELGQRVSYRVGGTRQHPQARTVHRL
jgi:cold shock protein